MKRILPAVIAMALGFVLFTAGCGNVTYPKATLKKSIVEICKREYGIEGIDVGIFGTTLAVYLPLVGLFNTSLSVSKEAQEKIQDVLLSASRVVLSTDADIKFYCVIVQDIRIPEIQIVIVNYVDDVKRAFFYDISRGEYFKRTLMDMNENPQAKKEQAIVEVFEKMKLDEEMQKKVLDDFFRSPPSSLEGIGYWQGKFYMKDITLPEFLAQQMASRIRKKFAENENLRKYAIKSITGKFVTQNQLRFFLINFNAEALLFVLDPKVRLSMEREIFTGMFEEAANVIYGYKFKDFELLKFIEQNTKRKLLVSKEDIYLFKKRKIEIGVILDAVN